MVIYLLGKSAIVSSKHIKRKILLLGDGAVGKTSLIRKFVTDKFADKYIATIGTKVTKKELELKSKDEIIYVTLMIWDVLGQKGYRGVQSSSLRGSDGVILVCDFTREDTLGSLEEYWLPNIRGDFSKLKLVFVANKSDLTTNAQFSLEDLQKLASKFGSVAFPSSAKTGKNVEELFLNLGRMLTDVKVKEESKEFEVVKDLSEEVTLVAATDFVINDFCNSYGDTETAMSVIRLQFANAGLDIRVPTKEGLLKVIGLLAEVELDFKDKNAVRDNRTKRRLLVQQVKS
ncbi:MAG: Rab family GTPase [Thermoplasmata archaeon]